MNTRERSPDLIAAGKFDSLKGIRPDVPALDGYFAAERRCDGQAATARGKMQIAIDHGHGDAVIELHAVAYSMVDDEGTEREILRKVRSGVCVVDHAHAGKTCQD